MTALFYQATIVLTILVSFGFGLFFFNSYNLSKVFGSIISLFWIYWTLGGSAYFVNVKIRDYSQLWTFQLVETIGVFLVCYAIVNWLSKKDKKIKESQNIINKLLDDKDRIDNSEIVDLIKNNKKAEIKILSNLSQHREIFFNTLAQATNSICILSGTTTSYVVDDEFTESIIECLKRGVNIYIGYGYKSSYNNTEKKDFETKAEEDLKNLVKTSSKDNLKGKIYLAEYKNHSKILICDDDYAVCGSFNWLSNAKGQNIERSYVIYDKKIVLKEIQQIKKYVKNNSLKFSS